MLTSLQSWLANEKVCVFAAFGWVELGIEKHIHSRWPPGSWSANTGTQAQQTAVRQETHHT